MTSPSRLAQSDLASVSTNRDVNDINLLPVQSVGVSVGSRAAVALDHDVPRQFACDDEHDESSTETASLHRDHSAVYASAAELEEFRTILSHREAKVRHSPTMLHRPTTHCMLHSAAWAAPSLARRPWLIGIFWQASKDDKRRQQPRAPVDVLDGNSADRQRLEVSAPGTLAATSRAGARASRVGARVQEGSAVCFAGCA